MRPATQQIPKSLLPVAGRRFAELQLEWLRSQGVREVIYCIGYLGNMVRAALGNGRRYGVELRYTDESEQLRGTAGALRLALDRGVLPEAFFLLNGDSYLQVRLTEVEQAWRKARLPVLMTVLHNQDRWDRSNAVLVDGLVQYDKRRPQGKEGVEWIDYGLSILTRDIIERMVAPDSHVDLSEVMRLLSNDGQVAGFEVSDRFYEVGSPAGLRDLAQHLLDSERSGDHT
jgi:NDP-sugar pyrophosphorylase family protein